MCLVKKPAKDDKAFHKAKKVGGKDVIKYLKDDQSK
jgi:hypothetical protein